MNRKIPKKTSQVEDDIFNKKLTESVWVQAQKTGIKILLCDTKISNQGMFCWRTNPSTIFQMK